MVLITGTGKDAAIISRKTLKSLRKQNYNKCIWSLINSQDLTCLFVDFAFSKLRKFGSFSNKL